MKVQLLACFACLFVASACPGAVPATAVINEFHEKPEDGHELEEFIELYNPGDSDLVLTGWKFSDAVSFTFPTTTLPSHGYLVVALNPASILTRYGITALGPWSGKLSAGETITLKDAAGTLRDSVTYRAGFPWPSAIDNQGPSAELLNPTLDNNLAGSWRASTGYPTPGRANSTLIAINLVPPHIEQVTHSPLQPAANQPVTITAKITSPNGMGAVSLSYQLVDPGAYLRSSDPGYETSWTSVPMSDSGTLGDATAGDSFYTAVLPAALQTNRRLVRYRVTFADALGNQQTVPYADDGQKNFAYYVYNGLPAYRGSLRPGTEPVNTFSPATLGSIPVYTLIANGDDVMKSQYDTAYEDQRFTGALVYDGVVYDNIQYRNRGQNSVYQSGKNKWKYYFNAARDFAPRDLSGALYTETWGSFSANACASPWVPANRGMAGVSESLSLKIFQLAGVPSPYSHYYQFRVVRNAEETPAAGSSVSDAISPGVDTDGQYAGDFWGLYSAIEPIKGNFLDERGLPDGNIYSIAEGLGEPEHLLPGYAENSADYNSFISTVETTTPTVDWWRANLDLDTYYTFHAINRLIGNVDLRAGENHYFYRRSTDNRWMVIPWDLDMMFIPKTHSGTSIDGQNIPGVISSQKAIMENPALALEFRNRAREVLDLMASDSTATGGQIGQLVDEFSQIVAPAGTIDNLANADAAMWNLHPRTRGIDGVHSGQENHRGNFFYTPMEDTRFGGTWTRWLRSPSYVGVADHADMMDYLRGYTTNAWPAGTTWEVNNGNQLGYGYQYLRSEAEDTDIPAKPVIAYTGVDGYPVSGLAFSSSAFSDPQGSTNYAATQWRVAEISAPGLPGYTLGAARKYEIEDSWTATNT
ncbi:MAG: hypothetical protein JWO82_3094, partial [Akkermansiaceae bacterium]|nr:hypothetical protein [Akkermansiaceae bacterium]